MKKAFTSRRLIGAVLFLAVFFLPLHFHSFTPTAQVSKECSCVHGSRTQVGLASGSTDWVPSLQQTVLVVCETQVFPWLSIDSHTIRAPPSVGSL